MNAEYYTEIYLRDLQKLHDEIQAYPNDETLWAVKEGISNSGGNLCLHLVGNLQHFIGATLGHNGYVRNRDKEFGDKGLTKHELIVLLHGVQGMLQSVLPKLTQADLDKEFPFDFMGKRSTGWYLNQFLVHFITTWGRLIITAGY
jgi:hypothetical protein